MTLVVLAAAGRIAGIETLGVVAVGMTVGFIITAASEAGTTSLLIREASRAPHESNGLLGAILVVRAATMSLSFAVALPLVATVAPRELWTIVAIALSLPVQQLAEIPRAILLTQGRAGVLAAHVLAENVAWAAVIIGGMLAGSVEVGFAAGAGVLLASAAVGFALIARRGTRPTRPSATLLSTFVRLAAPFAAFSVVTALAVRLDPLLVRLLVPGDALVATGAYFAVVRLVGASEYVAEAASRAIYPSLSRVARESQHEFVGLLGPVIRMLLVIGIVAPFAGAALGDWMMELVYGPELANVGWLVLLVALATPQRFLSMVFGVALTASNAHGRRLVWTGLALALSVALNLLLLPRIGVAGAAIAWIASSSLLFVGYAQEVRHRYGGIAMWGIAARAAAAGSVAFVASQAAQGVLPVPLGAPIGALVFAGVSVALLVALRAVEVPGFVRGIGRGDGTASAAARPADEGRT